MSVQVRSRRESVAFLSTYVGAQGELLVDTTNNRVQVHDGITPGGAPAAKLSEVVTNTRTAVADAAYTVLATDRTIAVTSLTAARTITLPAASTYPTGTQLLVFDESGACSASNAIGIARAGTDTINGAPGAAITTAYGYLAFESNGVARWTIVDQTASVAAASASRTPIADASYMAMTSDRLIGYTSLTAARTVTLPGASAYPVGTRLLVVDESGGASATSTITLARAGSDTINGGTGAVISSAYGYIAVQSNGAAKWTITDQPGASTGGTATARTAVADVNYTALASDRLIAYTALSAARTVTLPAAGAFPQGVQMFIVDESGSGSATVTITIARVGTDTINGVASAAIAAAFGYLALESNGSGKWTIVDQTPATSGAGGSVAPRSSVRQTTQGGPQSGGQPSFLPATSTNLNLTAQNVSTGVNALTVAAAQGYNTTGQNDVISVLTSNPTWSGLTASTTIYLHVNASTGATGSTTLQPIYQFGGTIATTSGQFTFDYQAMIGYMGNGLSAVATPLVFVGEADTSASGVTATRAYAYNGYYDSGWTQNLPSASVSKPSNLGVSGAVIPTFMVECTAADAATATAVGDSITTLQIGNSSNPTSYLPITIVTSRNTVYFPVSGTYYAFFPKTGGSNANPSSINNFKWKLIARRGWGGA